MVRGVQVTFFLLFYLHTWIVGVLLPGFCYTRRLATLAVGYTQLLVTKHPTMHVCEVKDNFVVELISIEEMCHLYRI